MAIQTIFVGTTPGDDTGDPARTCFIKINDNFTQPENAASRLVGTGPDRVPLNSDLGAIPKVINFTSATGTVEITDTLPSMAIGDRVLVRKLNATQGTVSITCTGHTFTRSALGSVTLNSDGDFWLIEKVTATRLDLVDGYAKHVTGSGEWVRSASGEVNLKGVAVSPATWTTDMAARYNMFDTDFPSGFAYVGSMWVNAIPSDGDIAARSSWVTFSVVAGGKIRIVLAAVSSSTGSASINVNYTAKGWWY